MNTEPRKTAFSADGHPDENQLLLALERELSPEEAAEIASVVTSKPAIEGHFKTGQRAAART